MENPGSRNRELFLQTTESPRVNDVIISNEFYHQKALDKYIEFRDFEIRNKQLFAREQKLSKGNVFERLILDFDEYRKTDTSASFGDFLSIKNPDSVQYKILLTIGQLIAYIDLNAYNRSEWNEYEDKRVIARAGVYQPQWVVNLLRFKSTGNDFKSVSPVIRNALLFLKNPGERINVLAPRHREYIIRNLFIGEYREEYFDPDVFAFFNEMNLPIKVSNQINLGVLYARMLYNTNVRAIWDEKNKERLEKSKDGFDSSTDDDLWQEDSTIIDVDKAEKEIKEIIVNIKGSPVSQADRIAEKDLLGREKLIEALYRMIRGTFQKEGLPLTIGLFGNWGSGKSSIVELVIKELNRIEPGKLRTVRFNAWQHEHVQNMAAAIAQQTVKTLTYKMNFLRLLILRLQFAFIQHFWSSLLSFIGMASTATFLLVAIFSDSPTKESIVRSSEIETEKPGSRRDSVVTTYKYSETAVIENLNKREELKNDTTLKPDSTLKIMQSRKVTISNDPDQIKALDDKVKQWGSWLNILLNLTSGGGFFLFLYFLKRLSDDPLTTKFFQSTKIPDYSDQLGLVVKIQKQLELLTKLVLKKTQHMVVFIDDLDRCSKSSIIKTFEAAKLVMDLDKTIAILAIDQRIALQAIGEYYSGFSSKNRPVADIARDYLGKIIQLPIRVSDPDPLNIEDFVKYELFKDRTMETSAQETDVSKKFNVKVLNQSEGVGNGQPGINQISTDNSSTIKGDKVSTSILEVPTEKEKPTMTEEDKDMEETEDEVKYFIRYTNFFRFTNPRLMRRLRNSYRVLKKIESGKDGIKLMFMLFLLEFLYSRSSTTTIAINSIDFDQDVFNDNQFNSKILDEVKKLNITDLTDLQRRTEQVVLPFTPAE